MKFDLSSSGGLGEGFIKAAGDHPDRVCVVTPSERLTYGDMLAAVQRYAAGLRKAGLQPGQVLGLQMEDGVNFLQLMLGAAVAGLTTVVLPLDVRPTYLAPRLPVLGVDLFIVSGAIGRASLDRLPEAHRLIGLPTAPIMHVDDPAFADLIASTSSEPLQEHAVRAQSLDQPALVVFTSGVTGLPKNCWISHRNILSKVVPLATRFEMSGASRLWIGVSMFQIGFITPFLTAMMIGATVVLSTGLNAKKIGPYLGKARVTHAYPIYMGNWLPIVGNPSFLPSELSALSHVCLIGPISALRRVQRSLPQAVVMNTYGSAEEGGAFCMPRADDPAEIRLGSSGKPFQGHEVRIVDPEDNSPMPQGTVGEIQVRGPGVPLPRVDSSYGSQFTPDGWLRTSDLGLLRPGGSLVFRGRVAEMLKIGRETVSAVEIETALLLHPDVAVAQVIGRPDEELGEVAAAFVELRPGVSVSAEKLIAFCAKHLPATCVPRYLRFMSSWPTSSSKIFKPSLSEMPLGPRLLP